MIIEKESAPLAPASAASASHPAIPKVIHQTFESADVPDRMYEASQSWRQMNPEYAHCFHDRDDRRGFIETHFPKAVLGAYDKIENGAFRADLWRYCLLYIHGGVYADIDSVARAGLSGLIRPDDTFLVARAGNLDYALFNGFICVRPGHPFMKAALERATRLVNASARDLDGFMATGPGNLGKAVNAHLGRGETTAFDYGPCRAGGFDFRILEKSRDGDGVPHVAQNGEIFLWCDYAGYRDDLKSRNITHWQDQQVKPAGLWKKARRQVKRVLRKLS